VNLPGKRGGGDGGTRGGRYDGIFDDGEFR